eukprot:362023-Chlamydomonas_euryale.AAC.1
MAQPARLPSMGGSAASALCPGRGQSGVSATHAAPASTAPLTPCCRRRRRRAWPTLALKQPHLAHACAQD